MRFIFALALLALLLPGQTRAQSVADAIQSVISRQVEAFRADDLPGAFQFASPMIQSMFRNPETFGRMVRDGYPMVWRPAEMRYGSLEARDGMQYQTVIFRDQAGTTHYFAYEMIPGRNGWRINGVYPTRPPAVGA